MFPKITELQFEQQLTEDLPQMGKSFLFDFETGELVIIDGKLLPIEGLEALKQWVNMTLRTEKYRFKIYEDTEYGVTLEDLIGSNLPQQFIEAEIKREVTESLLRHPLITEITQWTFTRKKSWMFISFSIVSPLGESEVTYDVPNSR